MLKVPLASPPVPQVSMAPSGALTVTRLGAHGARGAGDLVDRLAAHPHRHQKPADFGLRWRRRT